MIVNIFRNYGCLSAEKTIIYTYGMPQPTAKLSEEIAVKVPKGWKLYENSFGETMITSPCGQNYSINDVLDGNEFPHFSAIDKDGVKYNERLVIVDGD